MIGPCNILQNILDNDYVLYFLEGLDISPTSNTFDLCVHEGISDGNQYVGNWKEYIPKHKRDEITNILKDRVVGKI